MMVVMCACVVSCMMSMMGMGPFGGLFSGASSLLGGVGDVAGGAGDLVSGAGSGIGQGLSALGDVFSGEAFKGPSLSEVDPGSVDPATQCKNMSVRARQKEAAYNRYQEKCLSLTGPLFDPQDPRATDPAARAAHWAAVAAN